MIPILSFVACSGTGKTTLLLKIIPILKAKGLRIGMIKHTHHKKFDIDYPGKDSYRLRKAGAEQMLVASSKRYALMVELDGKSVEPNLKHLLLHLDQRELDLVLVEGFKHERLPKIEIYRPSLGNFPFFPEDDSIIAIACDAPPKIKTNLPLLDMNHPRQVVAFIEEFIAV